jgi:SNF2 family DNA or RNA helicase
MQSLFDNNDIALKLQFGYADAVFDYASNQRVQVTLTKKEDSYIFYRTKRNRKREDEVKELLEGMGIIQFNQSYFKLKNSKLLPAAGTLLSEEATNKYDFLEWLNENHEMLKQNKIKIIQNEDSSSKYFIGKREIKIEVKEQKDWFDVQAMVKFGEFSFPFLSLREYILKGKREFILPNGMIAIIPNEWFGNLSGILEFSKNDDDIQLDKHHIGLLDEIANQGGKYLQLSDKLEQIKNYGQIKEMALPEKFAGELRPYQKAGFDWFYFLKENQFGGCLADDMGLGKTIQTLALLQKERELYIKQVGKRQVDLEPEIVFEERTSNLQHAASTVQLDLFASNSHTEKEKTKEFASVPVSIPNNALTNNEITIIELTPLDSAQGDISLLNNQLTNNKITNNEVTNNTTFIRTSLIIVPNSLVYNWYNEAMKFTPDLKVLVHTGVGRSKSVQVFARYDLIISTYGTARVDVDVFKAFKFNYIILDESQAIKNPQSLSSRAVRQLKSSNRLVLTGTPIENSVQELWSQLSFINSGMFGSLASFTERFVLPIEKGKDLQKLNQLKAIIKPFVLRRTKDQVAQDLPEKTEQVIYCPMSEEQQEAYETVKSYYRNEIIKSIRELGLPRSQFTLLQGLTKLRQIANHPKLSNETYEHGSGKFNEIMYRAETAQAEGHKVLMFSQFVKQLHIFSKYFDEKGIKYAYLDGSLSSEERQRIVSDFQQNEGISFFLISLKAGGVGLNLTSADYVFMIDPWWNPAVERQAVDRAHRIGQQKSVFIYKFITKDTVEEKILALQEKKKNLADSLITTEESFIKNIDVDEIMDILN